MAIKLHADFFFLGNQMMVKKMSNLKFITSKFLNISKKHFNRGFRFVAFILLLASFLAFTSCVNDNDTSTTTAATQPATTAFSEKTIKIGVLEPQSGEDSVGGKLELLGIKFANKTRSTVEIGGTKYKIELTVMDDCSSYQSARETANKLLADGVCAVLGSFGSNQTDAAASVLQDANIAMVGANNLAVSKNANVFSLSSRYDYQAKYLSDYAYKTLKAKKAGIISTVGNYDDMNLAYFFAQKFKALGGSSVMLSLDKNNPDFASIIKMAISQKCDFIFLSTSPIYADDIIKTAYNSGLNLPFLASSKYDCAQALNAAWNYDAKLYALSSAKIDTQQQVFYDFSQWILNNSEAASLNGSVNDIYSASILAYDAYNTLIDAIASSKSVKPKNILQSLKKIKYDGLTGKISFNSSGFASNKKLYIKQADTAANVWVYE